MNEKEDFLKNVFITKGMFSIFIVLITGLVYIKKTHKTPLILIINPNIGIYH